MPRVNEISFRGTEMNKEWVDQPQIGGSFQLYFSKSTTVDIEVIGQKPIHLNIKLVRQTNRVWFDCFEVDLVF